MADESNAESGFLVERHFDADGKLLVRVAIVGDAKITEAHTVLALALRLIDSDLGL